MAHTFPGGIHLPFDVIHLIISELASDEDLGSLRACSLTCKAMLPLARNHIFATIEVDNVDGCEPGESPPANRFKRLLASDPSIADYIRSFKYVEFLNRDHDRPRWPVLRNATSLEFGFSYYDDYYGSNRQTWKSIAESLRTSFCHSVSSNSIQELSLCNISFPVSLFHEMPHLTSLEISNLTFVDVADRGRLRKAKLTRLLICKIRTHARDLKSLLGGTFDLSQLQELSMEFLVFEPSYDLEDVVGDFISASEQLRTLSYQGQDPLELAKYLHPGSLTTLKALNMSPRIYDFGDDPYLSLAPQFEEFAGKNVFESVKFCISVESFTPCDTDPAEWEKIDNILSKSDGFPFLRRVEITVLLGNNDPIHQELEKDLWDIGKNHFPLLRDCDGLTFLFEVVRGTEDYIFGLT